ncbi:MAG: c-type cytochrome [Planctomycetales bacterium]|nr:c-type cytochrome [Planctomycetales bacterium]
MYHKTLLRGVILAAILAQIFVPAAPANAQLPEANLNDYNQWKLALDANGVASPVSISALPGYAVEMVRQAGPGEGSWISLAFDPKGRMVVTRETKGLLRMTLDAERKAVIRIEEINSDLLECRSLLFAHGALYVSANNSLGIYRLKDTDGDDTYDEVKLLKKLEGGVGHGRNGLALGKDGKIYLACGNNVRISPDISPLSPYRNPQQDRLLPCVWNEFLFDSDAKPPCGHVLRFDAEGKTWELVAGGFRNPYDLAVNPDGDMFTYDADMEWDAGASWYRPTCVMHVVPGGEYGWRQETNLWPNFFADSLPRVVDIGLGSPTGVAFGTGSKFPHPYQKALFILDWAYGRIIAVHLTPKDSSYIGRAEVFVKGKPLNLTDLAFGPDGAMYFTVGGRGTQSVIYRVRWTGEKPVPVEEYNPEADIGVRAQRERKLRETRRKLEEFAASEGEKSLDEAWGTISHSDPFLRSAARVAIENHAPIKGRRLDDSPSTDRQKFLELRRQSLETLAVTRTAPPAERKQVYDRLFGGLSHDGRSGNEAQLIFLRALELAFIRLGAEDVDKARFRVKLEAIYPGASFPENYLLCELLVYLDSPKVIAPTLKLLGATKKQEEQMLYIYTLRNFNHGWSLDQRREFLTAVKKMDRYEGSSYMQRFVGFIRSDVVASLNDEEQRELASLIAKLGSNDDPILPAVTNRPHVHEWTMEEVLAALDKVKDQPRNLDHGRQVFGAALCSRCHRLRGEGGTIGPDLAGAAARYSRRDLVDAMIHPSRVIDEKYRDSRILTTDGEVVVGQLAGGDKEQLYFSTSPFAPAQIIRIRRDSIETRQASSVSPMPTGLLNTLTEAEILDLTAWVESGGK